MLDRGKYRHVSPEIGGLEVGLFPRRRSVGTIAIDDIAYDMMVSDAIYGPCELNVSRQRFCSRCSNTNTPCCSKRLDAKRGETTRFFVFAQQRWPPRSFFPARRSATDGWASVSDRAVEPKRRKSFIHVRMLDQRERPGTGVAGHHRCQLDLCRPVAIRATRKRSSPV